MTRHGLIPNLHDKGHSSRFNARDATWFFMQSVQEYIKSSPEGIHFLDQSFALCFPTTSTHMTIRQLMQHILQSHAEGISFREWNAGKKIDEHMKDEGFNINIRLDKETGIVYGGN